MPTVPEIVALLVAFLSGIGALAGVTRALGQNRNERTNTLTDEQKNFRADLIARNAYLSGRVDAIDVRNAELVQANALLLAKVEIYESRIEHFGDQLTVSFADRERLSQTVKALDTKVKAQELEIAGLHDEIAKLQRRREGDVVAGQQITKANTAELQTNTAELQTNSEILARLEDKRDG